jgi:primosomal replication protein N''
MTEKICPNCHQRRPFTELFCQGLIDGVPCQWDLTSVPLIVGAPDFVAPAGPACPNGHPVSVGDLICPFCGLDVGSQQSGFGEEAQAPFGAAPELTRIEGFELISRRDQAGPIERFAVARDTDGVRGILTLYPPGVSPAPGLYEALKALAPAPCATVLATGTHEGRHFEIVEAPLHGTFAELTLDSADSGLIREMARALGEGLRALGRAGLRHCDLRPDAILVNRLEPLRIAISGFGLARLSAHDLDLAALPELSRYLAPETLTGAVASASDWWSLGILLLEKLTRGACFAGISDQAYLMHVVANGAEIPPDLDDDLRNLLRGLLARDRRQRWQWSELESWLRGEPVPAPSEARFEPVEGAAIQLGGKPYRRPSTYALAAGHADNWNEASSQLAGGAVATWLEAIPSAERMLPALRNLMRRDGVDDDLRLSLALKILNPDMPLTRSGMIVTPGWLLRHPAEGYSLISGPAAEILSVQAQEPWLAELNQRESNIRRRAAREDIELNEEILRVNLLATSRVQLAAVWEEQRLLTPDSDHKGLAAIMEKRQPGVEDLILLLSAAKSQFQPLDEIVAAASELAQRAGIAGFAPKQAALLLREPRSTLLQKIDERLANFARCRIDRADEWADQYRLERRISLPRAAALLALPAELWKAPPQQEYYTALLTFFERRITTSVSRGPLARMTVTKTAPRLDLAELDTPRRSAAGLLDHLLERSETSIDLDPSIFLGSVTIERRLRVLVSRIDLLRRETGINGLYLGFPFILVQPRDPDIRPRIAPVLLWPVRIGTEIGRRGSFSLAFDRERDDVRLNPALQGILGLPNMDRFLAARDNILSASVNASGVIDEIAPLATRVRRREVGPLPGPDTMVAAGAAELVSAAVLFHVTFSGQAIVEDLHQLRSIPPAGTALAIALRIGDPPAVANPDTAMDSDRFTTAASDPSQDDAVEQARSSAGLLIEGPPGTGKSQTIVNMVADAVGRKRSIAIVCQKQAALDVVYKRLQREGLGERLIMVKDLVKDRRRIIEAVRNQVERLLDGESDDGDWQQRRRVVLDRIRRLELAMNGRHEAMYQRDPLSGSSYRQVLGRLIAIEARKRHPDIPGLRALLADWSAERITAAADVCEGLAQLWLRARYEQSPLAATRPFGWDAATLEQFAADLAAFRAAEHARPLETPRVVVADPEALRRWIRTFGNRLCGLPGPELSELAWYVGIFVADLAGEDTQQRMIDELMALRAELAGLLPRGVAPPLAKLLEALDDPALHRFIMSAERALRSASIVGRLSLARYRARRRLRRLLAPIFAEVIDTAIQEFLQAARDTRSRRALAARLIAIAKTLEHPVDDLHTADAGLLIRRIDAVRARILRGATIADMVVTCPDRPAAIAAARQAQRPAFESLMRAIDDAITHHDARRLSLARLEALGERMEPVWGEQCRQAILNDQPTDAWTAMLSDSMPSLAAYQQFRVRANALDTDALTVFAALRPAASELEQLPPDELHAVTGDIILREACLAEKHRIEQNNPTLLTDPDHHAADVKRLAEAEAELSELNRVAMTSNIHRRSLGMRAEWAAITRFTGARARRLREFMDLGLDIGLMELRPVWLMSPDIASRLLPLRKGLFNTIIYDEASQMPIELALPTLFRAVGVVVSGDEKQLPPSAFFTSRMAAEEDDEVEIANEESDDAATMTRDAWNHRDIKDCPDLLQLAKGNLKAVGLKVHYRSVYPELIAYSNSAFYAGELNVPARYPEHQREAPRPIEFVEVNGIYQDRTNRLEAEQVVALLARRWASYAEPRPTIGIVTFNRDQADLIEELLEARAEHDAGFRASYIRELQRREDGEDVGLFVKNVENVQGDERDWIIFSTTFGRDRNGRFRRHFGVLGQEGGERRLNVAITRARQKVVILTSMPLPEISGMLTDAGPPARPRDHLQAYLAYAQAVSRGDRARGRALLRQVGPPERTAAGPGQRRPDDFAAAVESFMHAQGFASETLADGGAFGIDFAVPDTLTGRFSIGIECESYRHPILATARAREIWRHSVMRKAFPVIHRVSARAWYETPAAEQRRLNAAIAQALSKGEQDERSEGRANRHT